MKPSFTVLGRDPGHECATCSGPAEWVCVYDEKWGHWTDYFAVCDKHLASYGDRHPGFVYFLRGGDHVKIGHSRDVEKRRAELQTGNPYQLELLAQVPGSPVDERALHKRFAAERVAGEWFRITPELEQVIQERL